MGSDETMGWRGREVGPSWVCILESREGRGGVVDRDPSSLRGSRGLRGVTLLEGWSNTLSLVGS